MGRQKPPSVNSLVQWTVNRLLSPHGLGVLRVLVATEAREARPWLYLRGRTEGGLEMADLLAALYPPSSIVSLSVARASLSRTLRRLWTAGLVELYSSPHRSTGTGLSRKHLEAQKYLAEVEADPDGHYQRFRRDFADYDTYGSVAAFVEERRRRANRIYRGFYVRYVQITDLGRRRLIAHNGPELTEGAA